MSAEQELKFKREHFIRIDLDGYHYYYSFGVPGFEICLEPCAAGFDVAVYAGSDHAIEPKRCTKTGDYTVSSEAMFGDRKDEDWNKALIIADELLEKYMKDREKLGELLARQKCMFCGCTDNNACPGGCSWIELNVCSRCKDRVKGNDLISGEEIKALRARAKTLTMKEALHATLEGKYVLVTPMDLKSGFCVSLTILENAPDRNPIEVCSVGLSRRKLPDPPDADHIVLAVLGNGYTPLPGLWSKSMLHYMKRRA